MKKNKSAIKYILHLLKPYRKQISFVIICLILAMLIQMAMPLLNQRLIDFGIVGENYNVVVETSILLFILFLMGKALDYAEFLSYTGARNKLHFKLYYQGIRKILRMKVSKLQDTNFQELSKQLDLDIENISKILNDTIMNSVAGSLKIVGGLIGLFMISWKLALILIIFIPFKIIGVEYFYKLQTKQYDGLIDACRKNAFWYGDTMNGVVEIKLWGIFRQKLAELKKFQRNIFKAFFKINNVVRMNLNYETILQEFITGIVIYLLATKLIFQGELTLGGLFSFLTYSVFVLSPIASLVNIKFEMATIIPSIHNYIKFLEGDSEQDKETVIANVWKQDRIPQQITFQDVCLSYNRDEVLKNLSFTVNKGSKIAIVGSNGSGKTSLLNVLLRLYEPTRGNVYIDDVDIQTIDIDRYRQLFSVMSQSNYLFHTTIKENITMYQTYDDLEIENSCKKCNAENFILQFPEQYHTIVGNNGAKLSGGEKQKIAMSRTMIKKADILILDEATSNFDYESEKIFNKIIQESNEYSFVFIISHRPDILKAVDMILFIEQGALKAIGSYEELKTGNESFQKFLLEH